jgi:hypothetical protein
MKLLIKSKFFNLFFYENYYLNLAKKISWEFFIHL